MRLSLVLVCLLCAAGPAMSRAEVGIGPPVIAWVPMNSRLVEVVPTIVSPDDPRAVVDASVTATVSAGGGVVATLGPYDVKVTGAPQRVNMPLGPDAVQRLRAVIRRFPHAYATVAYVVQHSDGQGGVTTDRMESTMSLFAPLIPHRPTSMSVDGELFSGTRTVGQGTVTLPAPSSWPRTSLGVTTPATFGPIAITATCAAYAVAYPRLLAVSDLSSYLDNFNRFDAVRRGRQLAVRASNASESYALASAVGFRQIARHRFAGAEIYVNFDPECPAVAPRRRSFLRTLTAIVRGISAHVRANGSP
jgi:hypothetical protein